MSVSNAALPSLQWAVPVLVSPLRKVSVLGWKQQRGFLFSSSLPCPEVDNRVNKVTHELPKEDNKAAAPLPLWSSSGVQMPQVSCWAPMGAPWHWADLSPPKTGHWLQQEVVSKPSAICWPELLLIVVWNDTIQAHAAGGFPAWLHTQKSFQWEPSQNLSLMQQQCVPEHRAWICICMGTWQLMMLYDSPHPGIELVQTRLHTALLSLLPRNLAHGAQTLAWSPALLSFATWQQQKWNPAVRNKSLLYLARFLQSSSVCVRMCSGAG